MAAIITTSQLPSYLYEYIWEAVYAKVVTDQNADLATADLYSLLPLSAKLEIDRGPTSKAHVSSGGLTRRTDGAREDKLMITFQQRDPQSLQLANTTLANLARANGMVQILLQLTKNSLSSDGKQDFFIAGPCFPEKQTKWKVPGNESDFTLYPQPCASAYAGLTSADVTQLNTLSPAPTPKVALAANDGAFGAYAYGAYFSK